MVKQKPSKNTAWLIRSGVALLACAAAAYLIIRNWHTVRRSLDVALHASTGWLVVSVVLLCITFCLAAAIYGCLAFKPLKYRQTILVEVATAFANRLLPSGLGSLGLHGVYLYKRGHNAAQATVVVSVNNLVGMVGHLLLLAVTLIAYPAAISKFDTGGLHFHWWMVVIIVAIVAVLCIPKVQRAVAVFVRNLLTSLRKLRPTQMVRALGLAMVLTVTYCAILYCVSQALNIHIGVAELFIVFSVSMFTSVAVPVPGGLVGAEAGLFAGFVAYGVAAPQAIAAALLYRLVTYWLPLLPGVAALFAARRRKLV